MFCRHFCLLASTTNMIGLRHMSDWVFFCFFHALKDLCVKEKKPSRTCPFVIETSAVAAAPKLLVPHCKVVILPFNSFSLHLFLGSSCSGNVGVFFFFFFTGGGKRVAIYGATAPSAGDGWSRRLFRLILMSVWLKLCVLLTLGQSNPRHVFYCQAIRDTSDSFNCLLICDVSFAQPQSG